MKSEIDWNHTNKIIARGLYTGVAKILYNVTHKNLAKFGNNHAKIGDKILEIGSGRGEHLKYVSDTFSDYYMTDLTDWGQKEITQVAKSDPRIKFMIKNVENLDFPKQFFDRVIASCVISHVDEPYQAMMELRRVVKDGGVLSFLISADPGILLRTIREILTKPKMKNLKQPYSLVNAISHRNSANGLIIMSKYIFKNDNIRIKYYPFYLRSWNFSTHIIVNVKVKHSSIAKE